MLIVKLYASLYRSAVRWNTRPLSFRMEPVNEIDLLRFRLKCATHTTVQSQTEAGHW
jgi:hypothetical protein